MKKRIVIGGMALLCVLVAKSQVYYAPMRAPAGAVNTKVKLPPEVQVEFKLDFPKATDVYWESEYGGTFTASFIDTTVINVTYNSTGSLLYTEAQITPGQLPHTITADISKRYPGWDIVNARLITDARGVKTYNALLQKNTMKNSYEVTYNVNNKYICVSPPLPKIVQ